MKSIVTGEYYHIYNRGVDKQRIFLDKRDWIRFLFLIIYLQPLRVFKNIGRQVSYFVQHSMFNISDSEVRSMAQDRYVDLVAFALMPNHFHLILREVKKGGVAEYMRRIQDAYTKYFNVKHERSGHLFQGSYRAVHIKSNRQLLHLSAYIHRNPRELKSWHNKEHHFPWSSYQDYLLNRWGSLLENEIILKQFRDPNEYQRFVTASSAKEILSQDQLF